MYQFTCVCKETVSSPAKEGVCPHCQRQFRLIWPIPYNTPPKLTPAK